MKLIIAGTRNSNVTVDDVAAALIENNLTPTEIVSGGSGDVDGAGERFAELTDLPKRVFVPEWGRLGKSAGPFRNKNMALYADALLAFWDGKSRGTAHMISEMRLHHKSIFVVKV